MKKRSLSLVCLILALLMTLSAGAEPLISNSQGYTAYLGESNYLYLTDPEGLTKVLQSPIASLDGITDEYLYCTTADSRRFEVKLDGSSSRVVTDDSPLWPADSFTLEEGVLVLRNAEGIDLPGIPGVEAACAAPDAIYYVTANGMGGYALMTLPLPIEGSTVPAGQVVNASVSKPLSITASPQKVVIVADNGEIAILDRNTRLTEFLARDLDGLTHAIAYNNKLITLSRSEEGMYTVLSCEEYNTDLQALTADLMLTLTPEPTLAPTAVPTVTPTATPKPAVEDDGRISKGDTGYDVRKMQRRLLELGYPVGSVDGDFGENTLLAVNLFQCAIGYRNRSYASESMLSRLYGKNAPAYDLYAPMKEGDEGADVKIMQTFLDELGYSVGEKGIDGKYGADTRAAVEQFQFVAGLEVTGEADAETLKLLYDEESPIPNATPTPEPTQKPTPEPTQKPTPEPTQKPTDAPTQAPTEEPTQKPDDTPASPSDL